MEKCTKAPWKLADGNNIINEQGKRIAKLCASPYNNGPKSYEEAIANANLIAAAPDMLLALREARHHLLNTEKDTGILKTITRAIEKAQGIS